MPLVDEFLVLQILADLGEPVEILGLVRVLLDDQGLLALGKLLAVGLLVRVGGGVRLAFILTKLQDGVVLQLLLDPFLQRHQRKLKDLHALDHAGR